MQLQSESIDIGDGEERPQPSLFSLRQLLLEL